MDVYIIISILGWIVLIACISGLLYIREYRSAIIMGGMFLIAWGFGFIHYLGVN